MMTRLAIVVLFTGLMGTAMAAAPDSQVPAQKAAAKSPSPGKVIADILSASGMKHSLDAMPASFVKGFHNGMEKAQNRLPQDLAQAMENSAKEAFPADGITNSVTRAMKKDYSEKRYLEFLADLSSPLARRMADLELKAAAPSEQEVADFQEQLASNPLSAQRSDLLHRLDTASRSTDLLTTIMFSISKGMMSGMIGASANCVSAAKLKEAEASLKANLDSSRPEMESLALNTLAYTYRDVSDADLAEYLKIYEKENSRHIQGVIYSAITEEFNQASARMGRGIMKAIVRKKAAMGEQACADNSGANDTIAQAQVEEPANPTESPAPPAAPASSAPAATEQQGTPVTPKSSIPLEKRQGGDITQCLEAGSKSDKDIAACAEKYRKAK
ncbi:MAG TPA: hypothetical protein VIU46_04455 [Gallionellaceae bacterium]